MVLSWVIVPASRGGAGRSKQDRALFFLGSVLLLPGKRSLGNTPEHRTCTREQIMTLKSLSVLPHRATQCPCREPGPQSMLTVGPGLGPSGHLPYGKGQVQGCGTGARTTDPGILITPSPTVFVYCFCFKCPQYLIDARKPLHLSMPTETRNPINLHLHQG